MRTCIKGLIITGASTTNVSPVHPVDDAAGDTENSEDRLREHDAKHRAVNYPRFLCSTSLLAQAVSVHKKLSCDGKRERKQDGAQPRSIIRVI